MNDVQSVGQVTIWSLPDLQLIKIINGTSEHEHFGSSLSIGNPYGSKEPAVLAVGMDSIGKMFYLCRSSLVLYIGHVLYIGKVLHCI